MFGTGGPSEIIPRTTGGANEPVIEELNSDDEGEEDKNTVDEKADPRKHSGSSKEPSVEHPDDDAGERANKHVNVSSGHNGVEGRQPRAQSYSFRKVTYGGINGAYCTSSISRRMGSDGVIVEERKDADVTKGEAEHRISKAIHDKGHSVTRKLNPDGKVDTMQTLHNMSEAELAGFEETWKGNVNNHLPGWTEGGFNLQRNAGAGSSGRERQSLLGDWALPSMERAGNAGRMGPDNGARINASGRAKKIVTIPID